MRCLGLAGSRSQTVRASNGDAHRAASVHPTTMRRPHRVLAVPQEQSDETSGDVPMTTSQASARCDRPTPAGSNTSVLRQEHGGARSCGSRSGWRRACRRGSATSKGRPNCSPSHPKNARARIGGRQLEIGQELGESLDDAEHDAWRSSRRGARPTTPARSGHACGVARG